MASLREIRLRVDSVKSTKKITYAMKLVAAAKLKRAQEAAQRGRSYTLQLNEMLSGLVSELGVDGVSSPFLVNSDVNSQSNKGTSSKALLVIFGGARGLCGGYNTNLHRAMEVWIASQNSSSGKAGKRELEILTVGRKPAEYCRRVGRKTLKSFEEVPEDAAKWPIEEAATLIEERFLSGEVSEVYFLVTKFKSAISMTPTVAKLLPMDAGSLAAQALLDQGSAKTAAATNTGVTLFEPSAQQVFAAILPRLLRSKLRQGAFDAKASETGARMTAMDAATKNAGELIDKLTRLRNKLRQNGITSQLLDIVGGAEAVNN